MQKKGKPIKIITTKDVDLAEYKRLLVDMDYHLASLHMAVEEKQYEEKLAVIDRLHAIQHEMAVIESRNPEFKKIKKVN